MRFTTISISETQIAAEYSPIHHSKEVYFNVENVSLRLLHTRVDQADALPNLPRDG